jgi:hypothetical protein
MTDEEQHKDMLHWLSAGIVSHLPSNVLEVIQLLTDTSSYKPSLIAWMAHLQETLLYFTVSFHGVLLPLLYRISFRYRPLRTTAGWEGHQRD